MNDSPVNSVGVSLNQLYPIINEQLKNGGEVRFKPHGVSMLPLIRQGKDSVCIAPMNTAPKAGDVIFYQRPDKKYVLHRIVGADKDGYILCGDNQCTPEHGVKTEWIIGIMTAVYRGESEISVKSFRYFIYLRLRLPLWKLQIKIRLKLRKIKNNL